MKIAFFGSSLVSSYWNGAATYYRGLLKALAALGHHVTFYEPDAFERQQHRDIADPAWSEVVVYPATSDGWRAALERAAPRVDLLVKASGVGVFDTELEMAVPEIASTKTITAFWDVDAPATLDKIAAHPEHHLRRLIPRYDIVFTYGGGDPVVSAYHRLGARACVPIYNALDPDTHHPALVRSAFAGDLSFLGNRLPDREARVHEFFLKPARLLPARTFVLGGAGWEPFDLPPNVRHVGHVGTNDHNAFFCSAFATLNINRESMARYGFSPPTRVFEAAGAGACLISDAWIGLEQFFEPGREVLVATSGDEVARFLGDLTPADRERIATAALQRVLAEHTYAHRAREVDDILEMRTPANGVAA
ncbi:MAG: glycosyltransferase [Xanthobacteraceae bacterium]|nr:glycosyltransferase [Xanthobacteraceae bacterium]MBV9627774.1 glycosyltransferase [Xanthobacteraceae bacterium]